MAADDGEAKRKAQREREERMRYEVLLMLYEATGGNTDRPLTVARFVNDLGVWAAELFRVVEWLDRHGYVEYLRAGPTVALTTQGITYLRQDARKRRSIRTVEILP